MYKSNTLLFIALFFTSIALISIWNFEVITQWGNDTMLWFWIGAIFIYLCLGIALSLIIVAFKKPTVKPLNLYFVIGLLLLLLYTFFMTTFVLYVW